MDNSERSGERQSLGILWTLMMFAVIGIVAGGVVVWLTAEVDDRPMPCPEGEVYVWTDYPDDAECVSQDNPPGSAG